MSTDVSNPSEPKPRQTGVRSSVPHPSGASSTASSAADLREDAARRLAQAEKRLAALQERQRIARETAAREEANLARLTADAVERFGTADPDALDAIEERAAQEFSQLVGAFVRALDDVEAQLANIEKGTAA